MSRQKKISTVKTAQRANTLKLVLEGKVVGSVVELDTTTAELRDHRERPIGTFGNTAAAVAEFERIIGLEEIGLDF